MSRYRAPAPPSSPYITPAGAARLRAELDALWSRQRPEVVQALSTAAAEGDRSENAEYIYRKKQLAEIDRRIRHLRRRLAVLKVVDRTPGSERVYFGARVTLEDENGQAINVRIVGPDEFDHAAEYISMDSPLAQALLKRAAGDEVQVEVPHGARQYLIVEVSYPDP